ncbi:MAG: PilX N-terminal domain-containing pilus assembly protein [Candidatus Deferrimicrobiaceae bacterium]
MKNERGSALVITLMLLLILTAIGIYAVNTATTEIDVTLQSKVGTVTLNAAEAGTYVAIDQIPLVITNFPGTLSNSAAYTVTSLFTGQLSIVPGYGVNYRFANFQSNSQGNAPPPFVAQRTIVAVTNFGPIPIGTMY